MFSVWLPEALALPQEERTACQEQHALRSSPAPEGRHLRSHLPWSCLQCQSAHRELSLGDAALAWPTSFAAALFQQTACTTQRFTLMHGLTFVTNDTSKPTHEKLKTSLLRLSAFVMCTEQMAI